MCSRNYKAVHVCTNRMYSKGMARKKYVNGYYVYYVYYGYYGNVV